MSDQQTRYFNFFSQDERAQLFSSINRGIERETLRLDRNYHVSQTDHPKELGSALSNPYITTDYSEALLEFITPVLTDPKELIDFLTDIHKFTYQNIQDEILWPFSMPCHISDAENIRIADYGSSNIAKMKKLYRQGLKTRYGSMMQAISGIHYNFSMPETFWHTLKSFENSQMDLMDYKSDRYLATIRNIFRYGWLITYLFGASPVIDDSFIKKDQYPDGLIPLDDKGSLQMPFATSLRMSDIGYQSHAQKELDINFNDLSSYIKSLVDATRTPDQEFEKLGMLDKDGKLIQISTSILQIENEYYTLARPKQTIRRSETPSHALFDRGVDYIELRSMDINPYSPVGISSTQIDFLDSFILFCLLSDSPPITREEESTIRNNHNKVINQGRDSKTRINYNGEDITVAEAGHHIMKKIVEASKLLDKGNNTNRYINNIEKLNCWLDEPDKTLSGRVLNDLKESKMSFMEFAKEKARKYKNTLSEEDIAQSRMVEFEAAARKSHVIQTELENNDSLSFSDYMLHYFKQLDKIK